MKSKPTKKTSTTAKAPAKPQGASSKPVKKTPNRRGVQLLAFIPPEIKEGMRDLGALNDRTLTQELVRALRSWLIQHNALPPAKKDDNE
jgi:hypothetical protein